MAANLRTNAVPAATVMIHDQACYYPGSGASVAEIIGHANQFRALAQVLLADDLKPGQAAPARFCAVQAIELYLNAFLQHSGESPASIRSLRHDFGAAAQLAATKGLTLRRRTAEHMVRMTTAREYLILRYRPEMRSALSQPNRLMASLEEVAAKVSQVTSAA